MKSWFEKPRPFKNAFEASQVRMNVHAHVAERPPRRSSLTSFHTRTSLGTLMWPPMARGGFRKTRGSRRNPGQSSLQGRQLLCILARFILCASKKSPIGRTKKHRDRNKKELFELKLRETSTSNIGGGRRTVDGQHTLHSAAWERFSHKSTGRPCHHASAADYYQSHRRTGVRC